MLHSEQNACVIFTASDQPTVPAQQVCLSRCVIGSADPLSGNFRSARYRTHARMVQIGIAGQEN